MVTSILADRTLTVEQLQRAAVWARESFEIHFDVCRNRHRRWCQRCDDLDLAAHQAERAYLEARDGR